MPDRIELSGLRAKGFHGVFEDERRAGQEFVVDLVLHVDTREAAAGDDLAATVDYGAVARRVHDLVTGPPYDLIETLADRIAVACLEHSRVEGVEVAVHKPQAPITVPFEDVIVRVTRRRPGLDDVPAGPVRAALALGANLGDREATLRSAVADLAAVPGVRLLHVSPVYETPPVGGPTQGPYLNAVVVVATTLSPRALLRAAHRVENAHGRVRSVRWGPRTLDVDVLTHGELVAADEELAVPHPRAHERGFVLVPWAAADPDAVLPGPHGGPVRDLAAAAPDASAVTRRPDVDLGGER
ncbi:MAG: 2-amino-4-hydroxy-6-hydroxymethyldihydropteridine diphosphokinase [Actinomycetes bacterium]